MYIIIQVHCGASCDLWSCGTPTVILCIKMAECVNLQEQQVLALLKKIDKDCASDDELDHTMYELRALVTGDADTVADTASSLTGIYAALRRSESRVASIALSLVLFTLEHTMPCVVPVRQLEECTSRMPTYKLQVKAPRLFLRRTLAEIALDLNKVETMDFITVVTEEMNLNPDRLGKSAQKILNLFERMEKNGLDTCSRPTGKLLCDMERVLSYIQRPDLIKMLKQYDPDCQICVNAVIELQSKCGNCGVQGASAYMCRRYRH